MYLIGDARLATTLLSLCRERFEAYYCYVCRPTTNVQRVSIAKNDEQKITRSEMLPSRWGACAVCHIMSALCEKVRIAPDT